MSLRSLQRVYSILLYAPMRRFFKIKQRFAQCIGNVHLHHYLVSVDFFEMTLCVIVSEMFRF
jgi:hypothetical protein